MQQNSGAVRWCDTYSIGLAEIDAQHMMLIELMNELWQAIASNAPNEVSEKLLERLEHYTVAHFGAEETLMRTLDYPDFPGHKLAHAKFVLRLKTERQHLLRGKKPGLEMLNFLRDWLIQHILVSDRAYADYIAGRQKPEKGLLGSWFSRLLPGN